MLNVSRIRAISIDLDDTLWPVWPTIDRAEQVLLDWFAQHAPATGLRFADKAALREIRLAVVALNPAISHDASALRLEAIRLALARSGEDPALAQPAFEVFFDARQQVELFDDALPALEFLSARFPLVSISNGNADLRRIGLAHLFRASFSAREFGVGKPDPRIFCAAAAAVEADPASVLHVGDDAALDVHPALGVGMQAAWVNRTQAEWTHEAQPQVTVSDLGQLCELLR